MAPGLLQLLLHSLSHNYFGIKNKIKSLILIINRSLVRPCQDNIIWSPTRPHGLELKGTAEVLSGSFDSGAWPWELLCLNEQSNLKGSQGSISVWWHNIQITCLATWCVMQFEMEFYA